jgi:hypothetical protein
VTFDQSRWLLWARRYAGGDIMFIGYWMRRVRVPFDPAQFIAANDREFTCPNRS